MLVGVEATRTLRRRLAARDRTVDHRGSATPGCGPGTSTGRTGLELDILTILSNLFAMTMHRLPTLAEAW
nr:hypothetical protein GCM10010200_112380 [Actinomadura rugatobispora]